MRYLLLVVLFATPLAAQDRADYPLSLEVTSYSTVNNGYQATGSHIGAITNATLVPRSAVINEAVLTTPTGKLKCTVWGRKHYLNVETYAARQISPDELDVFVVTKKGKKDHWKFKIIQAEKVE